MTFKKYIIYSIFFAFMLIHYFFFANCAVYPLNLVYFLFNIK